MNELLHSPAVKLVLSFLQATPAAPILLVLMVLDVLSGHLAAFYTKRLNSSVGWKGMTRKAFVILLIGVGSAIDPLTPQIPEANVVAMFYIANELLSILENAVLCGVPVPPVLVNAMIKAREFTSSDKKLTSLPDPTSPKDPSKAPPP
jgi:toxin secretion/phage lysis holin